MLMSVASPLIESCLRVFCWPIDGEFCAEEKTCRCRYRNCVISKIPKMGDWAAALLAAQISLSHLAHNINHSSGSVLYVFTVQCTRHRWIFERSKESENSLCTLNNNHESCVDLRFVARTCLPDFGWMVGWIAHAPCNNTRILRNFEFCRIRIHYKFTYASCENPSAIDQVQKLVDRQPVRARLHDHGPNRCQHTSNQKPSNIIGPHAHKVARILAFN